MVREGTIATRDRRLFCYAETAPQIWAAIQRWYKEAGEKAFPS
jgi:hypothetical protein